MTAYSNRAITEMFVSEPVASENRKSGLPAIQARIRKKLVPREELGLATATLITYLLIRTLVPTKLFSKTFLILAPIFLEGGRL